MKLHNCLDQGESRRRGLGREEFEQVYGEPVKFFAAGRSSPVMRHSNRMPPRMYFRYRFWHFDVTWKSEKDAARGFRVKDVDVGISLRRDEDF